MDAALVGGAAFFIIVLILCLGALAMRRGPKCVTALAALVSALGGLVTALALFLPP